MLSSLLVPPTNPNFIKTSLHLLPQEILDSRTWFATSSPLLRNFCKRDLLMEWNKLTIRCRGLSLEKTFQLCIYFYIPSWSDWFPCVLDRSGMGYSFCQIFTLSPPDVYWCVFVSSMRKEGAPKAPLQLTFASVLNEKEVVREKWK